MASDLSVVALISGGKDSLFSILHCIANGHRVVALANLYPPRSSTSQTESAAPPTNYDNKSSVDIDGGRADDLDSYMYQTVGHTVIPLYQDALGIPLYRQEIVGRAVNEDKSYHHLSVRSEDPYALDETECLMPLLERVMRAHPEVNAIASGAILSDYQRTRLESVALRLGLVPLSYLWHFPSLPPGRKSALLDDMALVGQDARVIKVASGGLEASFLWKNIAEPAHRKELEDALQRYGMDDDGALLGEGGEFETLAIDGPWPVWKKRIEIRPEDRAVVTDGPYISSLRILSAHLTPKPEATEAAGSMGSFRKERMMPRIPELFDAEFRLLLEPLMISERPRCQISSDDAADNAEPSFFCPWASHRGRQTWYISNMMHDGAESDAEEETLAIVDRLRDLLRTQDCSPADMVYTAIVLRTMESFAAVNRIYATLFTLPNPPARLTIAMGGALPAKVNVMMSVIVDLRPRRTRQALHVQSRSYWAPANIGPYSQAIATAPDPVVADEDRTGPFKVFIAGQIPLEPAKMQLVKDHDGADYLHRSFRLQTVLALQHLWRIGHAMRVNWWMGATAYFVGEQDRELSQAKALIAADVWRRRCRLYIDSETPTESLPEQTSEVDVWDRQYATGWRPTTTPLSRPTIPNYDVVDFGDSSPGEPPFWAVEVTQLPRECAIEWSSHGLGYAPLLVREGKADGVWVHLTASADTGDATIHATLAYPCSDEDFEERCTTLLSFSMLPALGRWSTSKLRIEHCTIHGRGNWIRKLDTFKEALVMPCKSIWGSFGEPLAAVILIRGRLGLIAEP